MLRTYTYIRRQFISGQPEPIVVVVVGASDMRSTTEVQSGIATIGLTQHVMHVSVGSDTIKYATYRR